MLPSTDAQHQPRLTPPSRPSSTTSTGARPPLPTRRSTNGSPGPTPAPRSSNGPKLPSRRTTDQLDSHSPYPPPLQAQPVLVPEPTPAPPPYQAAVGQQTVEAIYDYAGEDPATDLSFRKGDLIQVTEHGKREEFSSLC
ncbi:hypothetical protein DM01DRAFT_1340377 [Hesseltinella vesiculosa]|uniref:SH3 domain-containing protein n=1 Tax=Hesseltinella vesiculosa TaxID=101127 RepID=A0A1X2G4K0_9FUNG|nr:hypothetical protein DM01DRAFT_1340377 [Hesseltinella vesiculosa]